MRIGSFVVACLLGFGPLCLAADQPGRPNVLFILCDDLGYGDLGCYGNAVIKTPNLDRLAVEGMKLTSCYAGAPVCSPSRAAIMTGRNPNRLGIRDWIPADSHIYLKPSEVTVAKLLKQQGYRTGLVGKWHLASVMDGTEPTPGDHGFDHYFATQNNAAPSHENPVNFVRNGEKVGRLEGNSSTLIVDEALRFLEGQGGQPFALFVCFHAPHEPVATPARFTEMYASEPDATKRTYYGSVTLMDHEVGRLLEAIDDRGLRASTLVMFTSDNGPETLKRYKGAEHSHGSPGPLRGMKLHMYEGGYREPGIIRWPGKTQPGQVCDEPVCGVDVLPTLSAITGAGLPADRAIDGASFLPIFEGKPIVRKKPLYWQFDKAISGPWKISMRQGPWKILANASLDAFALYNLAEDIGETHDLAAAEPERVRSMSAELKRLHGEINSEDSARAK